MIPRQIVLRLRFTIWLMRDNNLAHWVYIDEWEKLP
jgi:hypothetical protein